MLTRIVDGKNGQGMLHGGSLLSLYHVWILDLDGVVPVFWGDGCTHLSGFHNVLSQDVVLYDDCMGVHFTIYEHFLVTVTWEDMSPGDQRCVHHGYSMPCLRGRRARFNECLWVEVMIRFRFQGLSYFRPQLNST